MLVATGTVNASHRNVQPETKLHGQLTKLEYLFHQREDKILQKKIKKGQMGDATDMLKHNRNNNVVYLRVLKAASKFSLLFVCICQ